MMNNTSLSVPCWSRRKGQYYRAEITEMRRAAWYLGFRIYGGQLCQFTQDSRKVSPCASDSMLKAISATVDALNPDCDLIRAAILAVDPERIMLERLESFYGVRIRMSLKIKHSNY
jgi:hypothetical protein